MRFSRSARWSTFAVVLTGLAVLGACSKKDSQPMAPTGATPGGAGGGGGGTTGTTFNLGPFGIGQTTQFTFPTAGSFGYHCIPHQGSGMTGTVTVDGAGADSQVVSIGPGNTLTFSPPSAHVKPSGYVRWLNVSGSTMHTVTSN